MTTQAQTQTRSFSMPRILLHIEGLAVFIASILLYRQLDLAWWLYPLLLLVPDVVMVGYFMGNEWGARIYNIGHLYALPITLGLLAMFFGWTLGMGLAIIWIGHIGMDRTVGYGFKYPTAFKETHFNRI
jgi:hypothetical protein